MARWARWLLVCLAWACSAAGAPLRVGFGTDKPPYVFEQTRSGLEVELVTEALRRAGYEVEPFFAPMERLHRMLESGSLDAIATTNANSGIKAHYSEPYIEYHNVAVALAARQLDIRTIADLGRYSVSAFQRARQLLGPEFGAMAAANPGYREEAQQIVRNRLLFAGRIDVVVGDRRIIEYFNRQVAEQVDVGQALRWYPLFPPTPYRVGFREVEPRDRFDAGLAALRRDGGYAAIERRYDAF
ncbi:substrate-binding periplasmic protein [Chitinimonas koreensis]|uniref:substrate-binding periplasmic protein n=1 Tax=Chitinimonas koreensis TaxID=356302 RepID=UPI000417FF81|nr:transporter substrate-binding domain-containing protein [Chitinimonas koreensis]QNM96200.1 transporter substrate-binding domain-containing protein [Chitinimonas koreensis]